MGSGISLSDTHVPLLISSHIDIINVSYSRDAILARYELWPCVCPSVSHKSTFLETDERIELVFGMGASFQLYYTAFK